MLERRSDGQPLAVICTHLSSGKKEKDIDLRYGEVLRKSRTKTGCARHSSHHDHTPAWGERTHGRLLHPTVPPAGARRCNGPSLIEWYRQSAAMMPTVLCMDSNSSPGDEQSVWPMLRGVAAHSAWDEVYDAVGNLLCEPPVTSNKMRGPTSTQLKKIGEHICDLVDLIFSSAELEPLGHVFRPITYASVEEACALLLPSLSIPSDHVPLVFDFAFATTRRQQAKLWAARSSARLRPTPGSQPIMPPSLPPLLQAAQAADRPRPLRVLAASAAPATAALDQLHLHGGLATQIGQLRCAKSSLSPFAASALLLDKLQGRFVPDSCGELIGLGADVNGRDDSGGSCLMLAARSGNLQLVEQLLERGAADSVDPLSGETCLGWAAARNDAKLVKLLLEKKVDVALSDALGRDALMVAAAANAVEVINLLKDRIAWTARDHAGCTARMLAVIGDCEAAARSLGDVDLNVENEKVVERLRGEGKRKALDLRREQVGAHDGLIVCLLIPWRASVGAYLRVTHRYAFGNRKARATGISGVLCADGEVVGKLLADAAHVSQRLFDTPFSYLPLASVRWREEVELQVFDTAPQPGTRATLLGWVTLLFDLLMEGAYAGGAAGLRFYGRPVGNPSGAPYCGTVVGTLEGRLLEWKIDNSDRREALDPDPRKATLLKPKSYPKSTKLVVIDGGNQADRRRGRGRALCDGGEAYAQRRRRAA